MSETFERLCPDCGDKLAYDARQCACGWGRSTARKGRGVANAPAVDWQRTCTWRSGQLQCQYPVGAFYDHASRGRCMFHRAQGDGVEAARIAEDSRRCSPAEYLERAKRLVYGDGSDNPNVAELRSRLKRRADGENVGIAATGAFAAMIERHKRRVDADDPFGDRLSEE